MTTRRASSAVAPATGTESRREEGGGAGGAGSAPPASGADPSQRAASDAEPARDGRRGPGDETVAADGGAGGRDAAPGEEPGQPRRTVGRPRSATATRGRLPTHPLRLASRAHSAVWRSPMPGAAPPPLSLLDEWIRPPPQPGQGPSGPGAPGPADSAGLPGRPTALISRQRRQAIADRRLAEEVQQDVRPWPQSSDAPPEPSAGPGGLDRGATTARTGGGRAPDAGGDRISLLDGSCSENEDEDPAVLFAP